MNALPTCLLFCLLLFSGAPLTAAETIRFDIRRQEADRALTEFARQAQVQVLFRADRLRDLRANPLRGRYSLEQGLALLLEGTAMEAFHNELGMLTVRVREDPASSDTADLEELLASQANGPATRLLEEIIVEVERREQDLQDTPLSMTAVGLETISQYGVRDLREFAEFVANLSVQPAPFFGNSTPSINIRGVGSGSAQNTGIAQDRSVGIYIDGIFYARIPGSLIPTVDVARIEVLRGPQGTLFGRNTTGGAITYQSVKASTGEFHGYLDLQLANFDERNFSTAVNLPLSQDWAMRAQYSDLNRAGYIQRGAVDLGNVDDRVARLSLRGQPREAVTLDLGVTYIETFSRGETQVITDFRLGEGQLAEQYFGALSLQLAQLPPEQGGGPLVSNDPRLLLDGKSAPAYCTLEDNGPLTLGPKNGWCDTYRKHDLFVGTFKLGYEYSDALQLNLLSGFLDGYQESRTDAMWSGSYARDFGQWFESFQHELQLNWRGEGWDGVGGLIYYGENASEQELTTERKLADADDPYWIERVLTGSNIQRRDEAYAMRTRSLALFGQATYALGDRLNLTIGVRHTWDRKRARIRLKPTPDDSRDRFGRGQQGWRDTDYRLALEYHLNPDLMFYAGLSKAYKAGIANDASIEGGTIQQNAEIFFIDPERVVARELGLRSEWFDNRLRFNLSLYHQDWTNRQNQSTVTDPLSGIIIIITENQPGVTSSGIELDIAAALTPSFTLSGALGTIDAKQDHQPGFVLESVPELTWQLGANYVFEHRGGALLDASLHYAWRGGVYNEGTLAVNAIGTANHQYNPAYGLLNGRISFSPPSDRWNLALYATNILDRRYSYARFGSSGFHTGFNNGSSISAEFRARPRTVGAQLRYNF